jgi:hypothetical protein
MQVVAFALMADDGLSISFTWLHSLIDRHHKAMLVTRRPYAVPDSCRKSVCR